jgi:hypothetical protein
MNFSTSQIASIRIEIYFETIVERHFRDLTVIGFIGHFLRRNII